MYNMARLLDGAHQGMVVTRRQGLKMLGFGLLERRVAVLVCVMMSGSSRMLSGRMPAGDGLEKLPAMSVGPFSTWPKLTRRW